MLEEISDLQGTEYFIDFRSQEHHLFSTSDRCDLVIK